MINIRINYEEYNIATKLLIEKTQTSPFHIVQVLVLTRPTKKKQTIYSSSSGPATSTESN